MAEAQVLAILEKYEATFHEPFVIPVASCWDRETLYGIVSGCIESGRPYEWPDDGDDVIY